MATTEQLLEYFFQTCQDLQEENKLLKAQNLELQNELQKGMSYTLVSEGVNEKAMPEPGTETDGKEGHFMLEKGKNYADDYHLFVKEKEAQFLYIDTCSAWWDEDKKCHFTQTSRGKIVVTHYIP